MSKYNNKKVVCNGITFDSILEKNRYLFLHSKQNTGEIRGLELQPKFILQEGFTTHCFVTKTGKESKIRPITYSADFRYMNRKGEIIIEDAKGFKTEVYKIKKKMILNMLRLEKDVMFREIKTATEDVG